MLHELTSPNVAGSRLGLVARASAKEENRGSSVMLSGHNGLEHDFDRGILSERLTPLNGSRENNSCAWTFWRNLETKMFRP